MGATKHEVFSIEVNELAEVFKALSNPARLKAVLIIANNHELTTTREILDNIQLSQSSISRHMKILVDTGLIKTKNISIDKKNNLMYILNYELFKEVINVLNSIDKKKIKFDTSNFYSKFKHTNWGQLNEFIT
jgi:DNA-binding transcriptional ArsR family regulator